MRAFIAAVVLGLLAMLPSLAYAEGRVELTLATEEGFPALETQQWYRLLTDLNVGGLTIRAARPTDKPELVTQGSGANKVHRITGILTRKNELLLPGGKFTSREGSKIAAWLDRADELGPDGEAAPRPFDLETEALARVRADLARPVDFATAGQDRARTLERVARGLELTARVEPGTDALLAEAGPITEELQGVSAGTALAYLLRPAGMGFAPREGSSGLEYVVFQADARRDRWPVGLPAGERRDELLPKLMDFLNVEIEEVPVRKVLAALGGRLGTPILLDHVALASQEIDVDQTLVSLPGKRTTYSIALRKLLGQARLKAELRTDEAGKPFFWVTTMIQPQ
jgi:hypothetical protein